MVFALKLWRHYLYGSRFEVCSDHKSLRYLLDHKELNMRQRKWLEFLKDYDFELSYHLGKANVVVNALSRKYLSISAFMVRELDLLEQFRDMSLVCEVTPKSVRLGMLKVVSGLVEEIRDYQKSNTFLLVHLEFITLDKQSSFILRANGVLRLQDRIYVPSILELRKMILEEGHMSSLSIYPGATKMY